MAQLDLEPWFRSSAINVIVHDGTVVLWGIVHSHAKKQRIHVLAKATPGVRSILDNLVLRR